MSKQILQLCHGYDSPFLDVARQYSALFQDSSFKVTTVFLTGVADSSVSAYLPNDEVIFLENNSKELRGLKLKQIQQLKKICVEHRFCYAIAHRYKSIYIALHIKNLYVIGIHHAYGDYQRFGRRFFVSYYKKRLALLGVSNAIRDDIRQSIPRFPSGQIQTLYNRIDYEQLKQQQLSRSEAKNILKLEEKCFYFVNIGRLHPDKDQKTLITAFKALKNNLGKNSKQLQLHIYGKGRLESRLQEQIVELGLTDMVILKGNYPCIANLLKAYDSFVLSSDHEPFGMVLLEAMTTGLPTISTAAGGAGEVVADSGFLFDIGESNQLALLMEQVYNLDIVQKKHYKLLMEQQIKAHFSNQVAKETFFKFDFVTQLD